jgi:hypothetical protein
VHSELIVVNANEFKAECGLRVLLKETGYLFHVLADTVADDE